MSAGDLTVKGSSHQTGCCSKISTGTQIMVAIATISTLAVCVYFVLKKQGLLPVINKFLQLSVGQLGQHNLKVWHVISSGTGALVLFGGSNYITHNCTRKWAEEKAASKSTSVIAASSGENDVQTVPSFTVEGTIVQLEDLHGKITKAKDEEANIANEVEARSNVKTRVDRIVSCLQTIERAMTPIAAPGAVEGAPPLAPLVIAPPVNCGDVIGGIKLLFNGCETLNTAFAGSFCANGTAFSELKNAFVTLFYENVENNTLKPIDSDAMLESVRDLVAKATEIQARLGLEITQKQASGVAAKAKTTELLVQAGEIRTKIQELDALDEEAVQRRVVIDDLVQATRQQSAQQMQQVETANKQQLALQMALMQQQTIILQKMNTLLGVEQEPAPPQPEQGE